MLLESRAGKLLDGVVGSVSSVLDRTRDVLDVVVDLLFIGGAGNRVGADEVDQRLDALDEKGGLIFEVILQTCKNASLSAWGRLVYLKLGHALILLET